MEETRQERTPVRSEQVNSTGSRAGARVLRKGKKVRHKVKKGARRFNGFLLDHYKDIFKILLIVGIVLFVIVDYERLTTLNVRELIGETHSLATASLVVLLIYFVKGIVMVIPAAVVYLSVGMSFPPVTAVILNTVGMLVELTASYWLGYYLGGDYIQSLLERQKRGKQIRELEHSKRSAFAMFVLRFVPIFPVDIISLVYGNTRYHYGKYMFWSMLGIMPRVILFTILGKKIYDWFPDLSAKVIVYIILAIIIVSTVSGLIVHFTNKRKAKKEHQKAVQEGILPGESHFKTVTDGPFPAVVTTVPKKQWAGS